ncbi:hypothetical protein PSOL_02210 [Candidatus Phytoplasma solani]
MKQILEYQRKFIINLFNKKIDESKNNSFLKKVWLTLPSYKESFLISFISY